MSFAKRNVLHLNDYKQKDDKNGPMKRIEEIGKPSGHARWFLFGPGKKTKDDSGSTNEGYAEFAATEKRDRDIDKA